MTHFLLHQHGKPRRHFLRSGTLALALIALFTIALSLLSIGCGANPSPVGTNGGACCSNLGKNRGAVQFSVRWPSRSRLIPVSANSIAATLRQPDGTIVGRQVVARPPSGSDASVIFTNVPAGTVTLAAEAYPSVDGTGVAQAASQSSGVVGPGLTLSITVTMNSTITRVEVTPDPDSIPVGSTRQLTATARDASGSIVLIDPARVTWNSSNPAIATVDSTGNVSVLSAGSFTITATESESGVSGAGGGNPGRLVLFLPLNEGGGSSAGDISGLGNNGTLRATPGGALPSWLTGAGPNGIRNVSGFVEVANNASLEPAKVTVEAWVRRSGSPGQFDYIVGKGANSCSYSSYGLYTSGSGGLAFYVQTPTGGPLSPDAGTAIWDGNWHYAVGTYDGAFTRLYVDGAEVGSGTPATGAIQYGLPTSNDIQIGASAFSPGCIYVFSGDIDVVRIWSRALSAAEISANYASGPP